MTSMREDRFERRHRRVAAALFTALAGLAVVLAVLLQGAWDAKRQSLQRSLQTAVALAAQDLETGEISRNATRLFTEVRYDTLDSRAAAAAWVSDRSLLPPPGLHRAASDSLHLFRFGKSSFQRLQLPFPTVGDVDTFATTSADTITLVLEGERTRLIQQVVGTLVHGRAPPVAERLSVARIDSVLTRHLRDADIAAVPRFAVVDAADGTAALAGPGGAPPDTAKTVRARLFPLDLAPPRYDLLVDLPGARAVIAGRVWPLWAASAAFLLVTVLAFLRTLRAMADQRRAAAHLVAFINNMTHEFKTPLATVSLACEALARRAGDDRDAARWLAMIRDENARLGRQVEHVLQMAQLERGELRRGEEAVDMAAVMVRSAAAFALQAEAADGTLACEAPDAPAVVRGDELHLAAVVDNLLDNAVKYADGPPRVALRGVVAGSELVMTVADRGPGIAAVDRERVFEPYYRAATGDRHDVKGFGLGLGFVRLVTELHGGSVSLDSRPGSGTTVTVRLPLAPTAQPGPLPPAAGTPS